MDNINKDPRIKERGNKTAIHVNHCINDNRINVYPQHFPKDNKIQIPSHCPTDTYDIVHKGLLISTLNFHNSDVNSHSNLFKDVNTKIDNLSSNVNSNVEKIESNITSINTKIEETVETINTTIENVKQIIPVVIINNIKDDIEEKENNE